jgi:iron complex outermembrane receptor protein
MTHFRFGPCRTRRGSLIGLASAIAIAFALGASPVQAEDPPESDQKHDILVVAQKRAESIENAPVTRASIDADQIDETINALNVEDTLKYLPSLVIRKRHIGDTQAPLATRTSGLGSSARSLIYADGALLSALIGNNNTTASPRWSLVSTEEIARIDVLYGPYSAAYPGNSIGAVVNITTRLPDSFEATVNVGTNVQTFSLYGTDRTLPAYQVGGTIGDRFGPLALFASVDHVDSRAQPLGFATAVRPAGTSGQGAPVSGGSDDVNKSDQPIRVFGATSFEHQVETRAKLKAALDLTNALRLTYVGSLFLNDTEATDETYINNAATGAPVYAGQINSDGSVYTLAASAFSNGIYHTEQRHWSHNLSLNGSGARFDWQVIGTLYDIDKDLQRTPTTALPAALSGGPGTATDLHGTGWKTLDAKGVWRVDAADTLSVGLHGDWFTLVSKNYALPTDWRSDAPGALTLQSSGKTWTYAAWAQDAWRFLPRLTLTVGGRYEWWRAYDGVLSQLPTPNQPELSANRFSPKASIAWDAAKNWTVRLSYGRAWRFPTVGELYQVSTATNPPSNPDPNLRPERADSGELAIEEHDGHGNVRLSFFNEVVKDALVSQLGQLPSGVTGTFVQNVDQTRARGIELAAARTDIAPRVDLSGSVTYADAITTKDAAFPNAVGKLLPQVPHWKATLVGTYRPTDWLSLTAAARHASRNYGSLDNSDVIGNTYQGFYQYFVVDLRAQFRIAERMELGLGVDNVNNDKYFLYHPFTQRSFSADVKLKF